MNYIYIYVYIYIHTYIGFRVIGDIWGFLKIGGTFLGCPNSKDYCILGSIVGSPYLWKVPYWDNGKQNGNYYLGFGNIFGILENRMETTIEGLGIRGPG